MNVVYSEELQKAGVLRVLAEQTTKRLEEVLGPAGGRVKAEWDRAQDEKGRATATLKLFDTDTGIDARFTQDEMMDSAHLRRRFRHLWGDLLQDRSHKQLRKLLEMDGEQED